jgi:hypothetical protein
LSKKDVAASPFLTYSLAMSNITPPLPFPIGTLTNFGSLTHYDELGFAHFVNAKGHTAWVGHQAFNLVQVRA